MLRRALKLLLMLATTGPAVAAAATSSTTSPATGYFVDSPSQYRSPEPQWFDETQAALRIEATRVSRSLVAEGPEAAQSWKQYLHWDLLERHLQSPRPGHLEELAVVRRWLYSNRPGLEGPRFAELRRLVDDHLDAVTAHSTVDLPGAVEAAAAEAAVLCRRLAASPNEEDAARLGRLLGWLDRVGQLADEVARVREAFSRPNVEIMISGNLIRRIMEEQTAPIDETIPLRDRTMAPATNPLQRERPLTITGHARTQGDVSLNLLPHPSRAKFLIVYNGTLQAKCRADAGPATLHLRASGAAEASQPVYFDRDGLESGAVEVAPQVSSRLVAVSGRSRLIREIAERRASHPTSRAMQQREARQTAVEQLEQKLDEQVADALEKIRQEAQAMRASLASLGEATAPLAREGAMPVFVGARSTHDAMTLDVLAGNRDQLGAVRPAPAPGDADLACRVHVSAFNNMAETITGGKRLDDAFFMRYGKVIHAELPVPLMVHSRATRWAVTARKVRPLELRIPQRNALELVLRIDAVEINEQVYRQGSTLTFRYELVEDELGELVLRRAGPPRQASQLPAPVQHLLLEKFGAFFGPTLSGRGVIVPGGGLLGLLRELHLEQVVANEEWIAVELNASPTLLDEFNRWREEAGSK